MKEGHSIDGALPDEMRRGGSFSWPPTKTGYAWEGLQGALVQAEILYRAGYDSWQWEDRALLRAVEFLYGLGWDAEGDDLWQPWLINARYGSNILTNSAARHGKIIGWTSWTHQTSGNAIVATAQADSGLLSDLQATNRAALNPEVRSLAEPIRSPMQRRNFSVAKQSLPLMASTANTLFVPPIGKSAMDAKDANARRAPNPLMEKELDELLATWPATN